MQSTSFITRLHEQRLRSWESAKEILDRAADEKRELTAEEDAAYLRANEEIDALDTRITGMVEAQRKAKESEETFAELLKAAPAAEVEREKDPNAELRAWLTGKTGQRALDVRPENGPIDYRVNTPLTKGTPAAGGNTVKTSFYDRLVEHLIMVSGVMTANPTVLATQTGESIQVPKTTAHSASATIINEASAMSTNEPTFGQVTLDAFKYGFLMQISHELANDTSVDLQGYLARQAGRALGNGFGAHLVAGSGASQPNGVLTAATAGITGGTVAQGAPVIGAPTADNLIDLFYSVIAPYRNSQSCGWLMQDATVGVARKLKDNYGQYIWQPGLLAEAPDMILGKPVRTDPYMPAVGSAAKSVLFGDFAAYFVRQVEAIRFERSDDFAFDSDVITYRVILRGDGDMVDTTGALKYLTGGTA